MGNHEPQANPKSQVRNPQSPSVRGTVLIVALWILVVLSGLVLVLAQTIRVEALCSANTAAAQQAAAVEQGAVAYVMATLDGCEGTPPAAADLLCQGVQVGDGAFWLLKPDREDDRAWTFGLADEAGKININTAAQEMLEKLPDMTIDVAPAIIDWRDADEEVTAGGAESEYYLLAADPHECKNAPFETVEELLLVRYVTRDLLFGEDANRNGVLDVNEDDSADSDPPDNHDGGLDRGIFDVVTVYSREPAPATGGGNAQSQPVNVNQAQSRDLERVLRQAMTGDRLTIVVDRTRRERPFRNVMDYAVRVELTSKEFNTLAPLITTRSGQAPPGLVNVNTASKDALRCLPELDESDVSALVAGRPEADTADTESTGIAWVKDALPPEKAVAIGDAITGKSYQYSADIVSLSGNGRAFRRCRVVVDAGESPPRLLYRQDLTHLGWPLSPEIPRLLRSGMRMDEVLDATYQEIR
jgi:type II secretory pathway component PulK